MTERVVNRNEYPARHAIDHKGVTIVEWKEEWGKTFKEDAKLLQKTLGGLVQDVQHIGSTSIPGLIAKPYVDILMVVTSLDNFDAQRNKLEDCGFIWCGSPFDGGRYLYNMHTIDKVGVRCHLHVVESPLTEKSRATLRFRDALLNDEKLLRDYAILKTKLAKKFSEPKDRHRYTKAKGAFVKSVLEPAQKISSLKKIEKE